MNAKERKKLERIRKRKLGLIPKEVWIHPDHAEHLAAVIPAFQRAEPLFFFDSEALSELSQATLIPHTRTGNTRRIAPECLIGFVGETWSSE